MTFFSKRLWYCAIALLAAMGSLFCVMRPVPAFAANDDWVYVKPKCKVQSSSTASKANTDVIPPSATTGDWSTPGSETNLVAQQVFDILTKDYGVSGAFAVGVMANIANESGFYPDRSQGAGVIRFGMNSKTPPSNEGGGGGLFQFTPYSKFTESSYWGKFDSDGWGVKNQIAFMWATEFANRAVWSYMGSSDASFGAGSYGLSPAFSSLEDALKTDDPRKAAQAFQVGYERPAVYHPERETTAVTMNSLFNSGNVPADPSKWQLSAASNPSSVLDLSSVGSATQTKTASDDECEKESSDNLIWDDFTGDHGLKVADGYGNYYRRDELPPVLSPYLIDPAKVGLGWNECSQWLGAVGSSDPVLTGQCVALSKALFQKIWSGGGKQASIAACNGSECADAFASANGGRVSSVPSAGAVASIESGQTMCGSRLCGHTFIVSHVFANGDILLIEQNIQGYSGYHNGDPCNWNYRLQTKAGYEKQNAKFYTPKNQGFSPAASLLAASGGAGLGATPALAKAMTKAGSPYVWAAEGPNAFDCSGLVTWAYREAAGRAIPHSANDQFNAVKSAGHLTTDISKLKPGDLVFWNYDGGQIDHVAFYLGNNQIFHAATEGVGVVQGQMFDMNHFVGGGPI